MQNPTTVTADVDGGTVTLDVDLDSETATVVDVERTVLSEVMDVLRKTNAIESTRDFRDAMSVEHVNDGGYWKSDYIDVNWKADEGVWANVMDELLERGIVIRGFRQDITTLDADARIWFARIEPTSTGFAFVGDE